MDKKLVKLLSSFSLLFIIGCQSNLSNDSSFASSMSSSSSKSSTLTSENDDVSSSSTSSKIVGNSSSSIIEEYPVVDDEEKYIASEEKRVNVTINVSYPESLNDVYVIGSFNNWGRYNTLNDSSYKVKDNKVTLSNVENGESYEYIFVQKIEDAIYTYNFNKSQVDSDGNQIVGYTKEGKLISQYCITQNNEKFSFVASEGSIFSAVVTGWKEAIYGENIEVENEGKTYTVPTSGYNLCVSPYNDPENVYYIPLEGRVDSDGEGRQQFAAYAVELGCLDAFTIYDGNSNIGWAETSLEPYGAATYFAVNTKLGVCALEEGTYDIYVKLAYNNNRIYIEKTGASGGSDEGGNGDAVAPTEGYALLVTPGDGRDQYYVPLQHILEKDGSGRDQYFGDNIRFAAGDTFVMFDGSSQVSWVEKMLEPYGQYANFTVTDNGIVCNVSGTYDIYAKFKWEDNTIYIGNQDGQ